MTNCLSVHVDPVRWFALNLYTYTRRVWYVLFFFKHTDSHLWYFYTRDYESRTVEGQKGTEAGLNTLHCLNQLSYYY